MPETLAQVLPTAPPQLPEDVWLRIASFLSTEERVRASDTCKAMQQLQVERISISTVRRNASSAASALLWVASHLRGAKTVVMNGWPVRSAVYKADFSTICHAMQPVVEAGAQPLSLLNDLSLTCSARHYQVRDVENPTDGLYLSEILRKAINLGHLSIVCKKIPDLPRLASLKHLSLRVEDVVLAVKRVNQALVGMPLLETLQLSRRPRKPEVQDAKLAVPACVQRLDLENVYPRSLTLGSGNTRVALCGSFPGLKSALERWSDLRGQVKGLGVHNMEAIDLKEGSELWDMVQVLQVVESEHATVYENIDLLLYRLPDVSLGSLTSLCVQTDNLVIRMPALPLLHDVRILCKETLCIDFVDPAVSAKALCAFELTFHKMCMINGFGERFSPVMESFGKCLMKQCCNGTRSSTPRSRIFYRRSELLQSHDPWAFPCGCVGCEGSLGPVVTWEPNGGASRWVGDGNSKFSEPIEFDRMRSRETCICDEHAPGSYDGSDTYDENDNVIYNINDGYATDRSDWDNYCSD